MTASEWWQEESVRGEIDQALAHINSIGLLHTPDEVTRCRSLFDALNSLWTAHRRATSTLTVSDSRAINDLLTIGIPVPRQTWFCESTPVFQLATFEPQILNHDTLRQSSLYKPNQPIPANLAKKASEEHGQLFRALDRWKAEASGETLHPLLKKMAQMLYIIRSNIAHGEKTPYGPDFQKAERDHQVCSVTRPVLDVLFEALLDFQSHKLAVYGSLAPGQANFTVIAEIPGMWTDGFVNGVIKEKNGLRYFSWRQNGERVPVKILMSPVLNANWQRIDQFEGARYRRILAPSATSNGQMTIVNIYEGTALMISPQRA